MKTDWVCEFLKKHGCSASASTIELANGSHKVLRVDMNHNHLVDLDRKDKFIGR